MTNLWIVGYLVVGIIMTEVGVSGWKDRPWRPTRIAAYLLMILIWPLGLLWALMLLMTRGRFGC